jgi:hypothetical protein
MLPEISRNVLYHNLELTNKKSYASFIAYPNMVLVSSCFGLKEFFKIIIYTGCIFAIDNYTAKKCFHGTY